MSKDSPFKMPPMVALNAINLGASVLGGKKQRKAAQRAQAQALAFQKQQAALLEKQKEEYRSLEFSNPYAGMQTQFENTFEDLTVNTQQADFMSQQGAQQRADILGGLRGAVGSSGVAGLAQSLANQGALQTQKIGAIIGQQEAANQRAAAVGAQKVQQMEYGADMQVRAGDAMLQQAESSRQATLLGMQYGQAAGANKAYQQSVLNTQQAGASANQMMFDAFSGFADSTKGLSWKDLKF